MEIFIAALVVMLLGFFATVLGFVAVTYREPEIAKKALEVLKQLGK